MSNQSAPLDTATEGVAGFDASSAFDALGDPQRRTIIEQLGSGRLPVGRLADKLTIGRPAVSKHLGVLEGAGLVRHESIGTRNLYALAPEALAPLQQWLVQNWSGGLQSFADQVARPGPADAPARDTE